MKKLLSIILILAMLFSATACESKETAEHVIQLIDAIGEVTQESGEAIDTAQRAYDSLSKEEKQKVSNHILLMNANTKYQGLKLYLEVQELEANGKADEAQAKLDAAWKSGDESYWAYLRIADGTNAEKNNNPTSDSTNKSELISLQEKAKEIARSFGEEYLDLISDDSKKISLPKYADEGLLFSEVAKVYTNQANLRYTVDPKSNEDYWNNIKYVMLTGNWEYSNKTSSAAYAKGLWVSYGRDEWSITDGTRFICRMESALLGYWQNGMNNENHFFYDNGKWFYSMEGMDINRIPTPKQIQKQIIDAYKLVKSKHDEFIASGKISSSSTQYDIAKVYSDWFNTIQYDQSLNKEWESDDKNIFVDDSVYGALLAMNGRCGGRAAAYQLMMRMEGITCYCLMCGDVIADSSLGHVVPWMLLDGAEYVYEHNMSVGLIPVDKESATANTPISNHKIQLCYYHTVLKKAGLDYDAGILKKTWYDDLGNPMTKAEFDKLNH